MSSNISTREYDTCEHGKTSEQKCEACQEFTSFEALGEYLSAPGPGGDGYTVPTPEEKAPPTSEYGEGEGVEGTLDWQVNQGMYQYIARRAVVMGRGVIGEGAVAYRMPDGSTLQAKLTRNGPWLYTATGLPVEPSTLEGVIAHARHLRTYLGLLRAVKGSTDDTNTSLYRLAGTGHLVSNELESLQLARMAAGLPLLSDPLICSCTAEYRCEECKREMGKDR